MSEKISNSAAAMLCLCGCALTNTQPDAAKFSDINLRDLYVICKHHSLSAIVCDSLERITFPNLSEQDKKILAAFQTAKQKAMRKNLLLDSDRTKLISFMEQNGIWYMPLKGVILKDLYPKTGLRQMADNDILFDEKYRETIRNWFCEHGYEVKSYNQSVHDIYLKPPVYNFEMHTSLYGEAHSQQLRDYYKDVGSRLVKDNNNKCGYHFTDEDFYVYFVTHGFKHFESRGNGLRFLLDMYVFLKKKQSFMDFERVTKELKKLDIYDFETNCRKLIFEIFSDINSFDFQKLTAENQQLLNYFLSSGTYGTLEQGVQNSVSKHGKIKYLLQRLFPGTATLKIYHPIFRHKLLLPIGWIYRAVKLLSSNFNGVMKELSAIISAKKK